MKETGQGDVSIVRGGGGDPGRLFEDSSGGLSLTKDSVGNDDIKKWSNYN